MNKILRPWMWTAAAAVVVYLLQLNVYSGIILMMMGGPLWPCALMHITMGLLVIDCIQGKSWRPLLAAPIALYAYGVIAWMDSNRAADAFIREVVARDDVRPIAYDPATQAIVFDGANESNILSASHRGLQARYKLDLVFVTAREDTGTRANYVLPKAQCPENNAVARAWRTGFFVNSNVMAGNACMLSVPQRADRPQITISTIESTEPLPDGAAHVSRVEIRNGSDRALIHSGTVPVLSVIPLFYAGCALNDSISSWQCGAGWMTTPRAFGGDTVARMAQTLGLTERTQRVTRRGRGIGMPTLVDIDFAPDPHQPDMLARAGRLTDEHVDTFYAEMPAVIAGEQEFSGDGPWNIAIASPQKNAEHVGLLLRGLETLEDQPRRMDARRYMALALMTLPEETWMAERERILRIGQERPRYADQEGFFIRLGDYGAATVPLFLHELRNETPHRSFATAAAYGLCRVGAAANTPEVRAVLSQRTGEGAFVALLRIGDRVGAERIELGPRLRAWRAQQLASVTPQSPRNVCRPERHYPTTSILPPDMHG